MPSALGFLTCNKKELAPGLAEGCCVVTRFGCPHLSAEGPLSARLTTDLPLEGLEEHVLGFCPESEGGAPSQTQS